MNSQRASSVFIRMQPWEIITFRSLVTYAPVAVLFMRLWNAYAPFQRLMESTYQVP